MQYNDQECVAAFNSYINLVEYNKLPTNVKERVKELLKHHRLKWVCFSNASGFGLRVFMDNEDFQVNATSDDTATLTPIEGMTTAGVDLDGHWVECPADLYVKKVEEKEYLVMSPNGRKFYEADPEDNTDPWCSLRASAKKFKSREEAFTVAASVNGIVIERV